MSIFNDLTWWEVLIILDLIGNIFLHVYQIGKLCHRDKEVLDCVSNLVTESRRDMAKLIG